MTVAMSVRLSNLQSSVPGAPGERILRPLGVWCGCGSLERTSLLGGLASTIGCVVSPLGSFASRFSCATLIAGGSASPGSLLSQGMLFRESRALRKRRGRPLVDLRHALGYLQLTCSIAFRGRRGVCHVTGSCLFTSTGRSITITDTQAPRT